MKKAGAWYTYEGEQLGQGRENAKQFLRESPELMIELHQRIRNLVAEKAALAVETPIGAGAHDWELVSTYLSMRWLANLPLGKPTPIRRRFLRPS